MSLYEGGVIVHALDEGAVVDTRTAARVQQLTEELAVGRRVATVVDLRHIGFADRDARELFARQDSNGVEVATALIVGDGMASWLAGRFMTDAKPQRAVAVFDSEDDAFEWALEEVRGRST